jgi:hypothetical protein
MSFPGREFGNYNSLYRRDGWISLNILYLPCFFAVGIPIASHKEWSAFWVDLTHWNTQCFINSFCVLHGRPQRFSLITLPLRLHGDYPAFFLGFTLRFLPPNLLNELHKPTLRYYMGCTLHVHKADSKIP